jgi:hypothetical protein
MLVSVEAAPRGSLRQKILKFGGCGAVGSVRPPSVLSPKVRGSKLSAIVSSFRMNHYPLEVAWYLLFWRLF